MEQTDQGATDGNSGFNLEDIQSTNNEIRQAVERNAIDRGVLFIGIIVELQIDSLLERIEELSVEINPLTFRENANRLGINPAALDVLDSAEISYPYYFCQPNFLRQHPQLTLYYRNIAMMSDKVMRGIGLSTTNYEAGSQPTFERAAEIALYLNEVISNLIIRLGVTPHRNIEMLMANIGDSLGGSSRNEVGRVAMVTVMRMLIEHLHTRNYIESIKYKMRDNMAPGGSRSAELIQNITSEFDMNVFLNHLEAANVKFRELQLKNGVTLLIDKQIEWYGADGKRYRPSADMISDFDTTGTETNMLWGSEVKGGADPAGSDEHWKTASRALDRILEDAEASGHNKPQLSFIGTTIVHSVAVEIKRWLDSGKMATAYNLTKLINQPEQKQRFLNDMMTFLGYG